MTRADILRHKTPDLTADVWFYASDEGGRNSPAPMGWGCPLMISKTFPLQGWDGWPLLCDAPLFPDSRRRLGFVFLTQEGAETIKEAQKFFLWEGKFIGEGVVVS